MITKILGDHIPLYSGKMRAATKRYGLEDVGRAISKFAEVGVKTGVEPVPSDGFDLLAWPDAHACYLEFCAAIVPIGERHDQ